MSRIIAALALACMLLSGAVATAADEQTTTSKKRIVATTNTNTPRDSQGEDGIGKKRYRKGYWYVHPLYWWILR